MHSKQSTREEHGPAILLKTEYKALLQVAGENERDFFETVVSAELALGIDTSEASQNGILESKEYRDSK